MLMSIKYKNNEGFTLIELLIVIAIISILSSIVLASLSAARAKAKDAKRLSDMHQIQIALELYNSTYGHYPSGDNAGCFGWDTSADGTFITALVQNKFLPSNILDPSINSNNCGNYFYYKYPAGWDGYCDPSRGAFYVLGIGVMESVGTGKVYPGSPGWSCPGNGGNDWQKTSGFSWITGGFEN
ncbi:MAG: prepilin-type N-terminal cleavage/methylation domain-containing protein [Patescibacteria group bacterium]|nr:prepilin-type N-terminal cleavage/methylation domain-containing protein [Patescibacteria group bacterium]